jgi:hypothetical protein
VRDGVARQQAARLQQRVQMRRRFAAVTGIIERLGVSGVGDGVVRQQAARLHRRLPHLAGKTASGEQRTRSDDNRARVGYCVARTHDDNISQSPRRHARRIP